MITEYRLSAAGIIFQQDKVLLVRCKTEDTRTFLLGPGGGVQVNEDLKVALKREVFEETRINVKPGKLLLVEDLLSSKYRLTKIWFLCTVIGGTLATELTEEAQIEGIVNVGWYNKEQLQKEIVYPELLLNHDWRDFAKDNFVVKYLDLKKADF